MATYELWLTDDSGRRLDLLENLFFFTYTRQVSRLGTVNFGLAFEPFAKKFNPFFIPDWRVEVWRSPTYGYPLRLEDVYMLRKPNMYTRDDGMQIIQFYGRNGVDLLNRRTVIQQAGTSWTQKTDQADDMMKAIVREQMLYGSALDETGAVDNTRAWPQNEFLVQADVSLGPSLTRGFAERKVYDILRELQDASFQANENDATVNKIYFDVVPVAVGNRSTAMNSPTGWEFRTYAGMYGQDRRSGIEFSLENENIVQPAYALNHLDEATQVWVRGNGNGASQIITDVEDTKRVSASRWNRIEKMISASNETSTTGLQDAGKAELYKSKPQEEFTVTLLNTPGSDITPRSLYGIDWDLGDLVRVNYANRQFDIEVKTIYVGIDDQGKESITGKSIIQ